MYNDYNSFPWIKFTILCLFLGVPILYFTPGLKWKMLFIIAVPVGVGFALVGKSIGKSHGAGGF